MAAVIHTDIWPQRLVAISSASPSLRGSMAEFRHRGIAISAQESGVDALTAVAREPGAIVMAPTDMTDMPLLQFVELAVRLAKAPILIGLAEGHIDREIATRSLGLGADGIISLPINPDRLHTAIAGLAANQRADEELPRVRIGDLMLDAQSHQIEFAGRPVALSVKEFSLLEFLMRHAPRPVCLDDLLMEFENGAFEYRIRARNAVERLRRKLVAQVPHGETHVETVPGVGYRINPAPVRTARERANA